LRKPPGMTRPTDRRIALRGLAWPSAAEAASGRRSSCPSTPQPQGSPPASLLAPAAWRQLALHAAAAHMRSRRRNLPATGTSIQLRVPTKCFLAAHAGGEAKGSRANRARESYLTTVLRADCAGVDILKLQLRAMSHQGNSPFCARSFRPIRSPHSEHPAATMAPASCRVTAAGRLRACSQKGHTHGPPAGAWQNAAKRPKTRAQASDSPGRPMRSAGKNVSEVSIQKIRSAVMRRILLPPTKI
jgi:hypothetical protein